MHLFQDANDPPQFKTVGQVYDECYDAVKPGNEGTFGLEFAAIVNAFILGCSLDYQVRYTYPTETTRLAILNWWKNNYAY